MDNICRLCCGTNYVNNPIFNDSSQIYLKMTACMPLKLQVNRDDHLPQKICDDCTLKIDDFYTFSNCAVEVQSRLKAAIRAIINGDSPTEMVLPMENDDLDDKSFIPSMHHLPDPTECLVATMMKEDKCTQTDEHDKIEKTSTTSEPAAVKLMTKQEIKLEYNGHSQHEDDLEDDQRYSSCDELDDVPLSFTKDIKKDEIPTDAETFEQADLPRKRKSKIKKKRDKDNLEDEFIPKKEKKSKEEKKRLKMIKKEAMDVQVKQEFQDLPEAGSEVGLDQLWPLKNNKIKEEYISEAEILYCCVCYEQYIGRTEMTNHYRKHVAENPIEVDNLILKATKAVEIGNTDGEMKTHKCQYCNKEFNKLSILALHYITHKDRKPYKCSLCEKTFKDVKQILKHGKTHEYGLPNQPPVAECIIKDCPTALKGELCPDDHLILKFKHVPQPLSKRFACDLCDEGFVYVRYLREHRMAMHPEAVARALVHRCVECGRQFAHANSLRRHLRSHTGERNFLCNVCGKALSSREHLKFHIRIHEGYKPHICKTCGKGFVKKCNLTLHERVHSGERPHVCPHCGKAFSQRSTLVIHERYHSGARPYVCPLCNKGFVAKGLLSMHAKQTCI